MGAQGGSPLEGMGFSVANKMIDSVFNEHAANKAFGRQKALMQMQNAMNVDNWRMQNAYNTPARIKERLIAAGLNPDMMYGQQGVQAGFASVPSVGAPSAPMAPVGTTDSAAAVNAIANSKLAGAQTAGQLLENDWIGQINAAKCKQMLSAAGVSDKEIQKMDQEIANMIIQGQALRQQMDLTDKQMEMMDWQKFMDFWKESNVTRQVSAQINRWAHENGLTDAQADQVRKMTPELIKQLQLGNANAALDFCLKELKFNPKHAIQTAQTLLENYGSLCADLLPDGLKQFIEGDNAEEEAITPDFVVDGHGNKVPVVKRTRGGKSY